MFMGAASALMSADYDYELGLHNEFVGKWNVYAAQKNKGITDLRAIRQMRKAWRDLEKNAGWPEEK